MQSRFRAGAAAPRRLPVFQIVAVPIEAYQDLPSPQDRWLLTCFSRYVDRVGKAFPTLRQLAADARMSLATVCRRMAELARLEVFQRERQPGGRYHYTLAKAYRPRWPGRGVPPAKPGVPQGETPEQVEPIKQERGTRPRERFADRKVSFGEMPDERVKWQARLRSWRQSRFWLPLWGPKPTEPGCFVPAELLSA